MRITKGKYDSYYIEDIYSSKTLMELADIISDTYRDDDTYSSKRVNETIDDIFKGQYEIWLDGDIVHIEVENGLGALDVGIKEIII